MVPRSLTDWPLLRWGPVLRLLPEQPPDVVAGLPCLAVRGEGYGGVVSTTCRRVQIAPTYACTNDYERLQTCHSRGLSTRSVTSVDK